MVALDNQNQPIEPVSEVTPAEASRLHEEGSTHPEREAVVAAPLTYPEQMTGRVVDFIA